MRGRALAVWLVVGFVLTSCSSSLSNLKVETEHDPARTPQMRQYKTYAFLPATDRPSPVTASIVRSVEETLAEKGYRPEAGRPDFRVTWHVSTANTGRTTTLEAPGFRDPRAMSSISSPTPIRATSEYREGTLVLDVIDTGSNSVVWRGTAEAELAGPSDPATRDARIREAVRRILDRFPPR